MIDGGCHGPPTHHPFSSSFSIHSHTTNPLCRALEEGGGGWGGRRGRRGGRRGRRRGGKERENVGHSCPSRGDEGGEGG